MMMSSSSSLSVPQSHHRRRRRQDEEENANDNDDENVSRMEKRRQRALEEAQAVLESPYYDEERLENFNLLGVVTNPRSVGGGLPPTSMSSSISHNAPFHPPSTTASMSSNGTNHHGDAAAAAVSWGDTWQSSLEVATHSIDSLNVWMDHVSKAYLGTSDESELEYYLDQYERSSEFGFVDGVSSLDGMELPPSIQALVSDLPHVLDDYLQINRPLAHSFDQRQQRIQQQQQQQQDSPTTVQEPNHDNKEEAPLLEEEEEPMTVLDNVPELFFRSDFDLTHAETFERLLVDSNERDKEEDFETVNVSSSFEAQQRPLVSEALRNPTSDIVRVHAPESLTGHLDAVELSLLGQVRSKSERFFKETDRFSQLKTLIDESLTKVHDLRGVLGDVSRVTSVEVTRIPTMDVQRSQFAQLEQVLDRIQQVVDSKSTIGPLMSTGDFLGVTQAVHRTRTLFQPLQPHDTNSNNSIDLSKLKCLSKTQDQLNQYQQLAVSNLSNQLVDLFLHWGSTSGGGSNNSTNNNNSNAMADFFPMDHASPYNASSASSSLTAGSSIVTFAQRQKVRDICRALELCGTLTETGQTYSDQLQAVIRVTVRTTISECAHDAASSTPVESPSPMSYAAATSNNNGNPNNKASSILTGVTSMTFEQFMNCLEMLFEQISALRNTAVSVHKFCKEEGITLRDKDDSETSAAAAADALAVNGGLTSPASSSSTMATAAALVAAAELIERSVSELLRMRKEAHSLVTFEEMRHLWDTCLSFTLSLERASGGKAYGLRSTLLAQAKAFVERKHESNMANLAAALDSERWTQCDVSTERQASLIRLCSGRAVLSYTFGGDTPSSSTTTNVNNATTSTTVNGTPKKDGKKLADAEVEGIRYKVVWSCLLLVEMVMSNVACAAHFQTLATNVVGKVSELLRLFNSRATTLVLGAGAIHSAARLKSINAKHLALVTQCLGLFISILPHVRAALMAQLPSKQHTLLGDLDKIKKEYNEHNEKVLAKFVSIIGGVVEHVLAPRIAKTDFDARANVSSQACCPFLEGIATNTKKMHQVLNALLPPEHLQDVFSRIFAYVDSKVPALFFAAAAAAEASSGDDDNNSPPSFQLPETDEGKRRMVLEVEIMTKALNGLKHVRPWEFGAMGVVSRKLDIVVYSPPPPPEQEEGEDSVDNDTDNKDSTNEDTPPTPEMKKVEENVDNEGNDHESINETTRTDDDPPLSEGEKVEESGDDDEAKDEDSPNGSSGNNDNEGNDHESVNEITQNNDDAPTLPKREKVEESGVGESNIEDSANETTRTDEDPPLYEGEKVEESGDDDKAKDEDSANGSSGNNDDDIATGPSQEEQCENSAGEGVNKEGTEDVEPMASQTISVEGGDANYDVLLMNDDNNGGAEGENGDEMEYHSEIPAEITDGHAESLLNKSD